MLICSLIVCVYLQVCVRDNMIFAHENKKKKKWEDKVNCSSPSNNWIWSRSAARNNIHTHCSWRVKERRECTRALTGNAKLIATAVYYCFPVLFLILERVVVVFSLSFSLSFFPSSSNRIFDHHLSSNEMTQIKLDYLNSDWMLVVNSDDNLGFFF